MQQNLLLCAKARRFIAMFTDHTATQEFYM